MSAEHEHEKESWFDTWWQVLVIVFGLSFLSVLVSFAPKL